jgi:hypothetical protein
MARQNRITPFGEIVAVRGWVLCVPGGSPLFNWVQPVCLQTPRDRKSLNHPDEA